MAKSFEACDIDDINADQAQEFAAYINDLSVKALRQEGSPMDYTTLVALVAKESRLDTTEVSFGIGVAGRTGREIRVVRGRCGREVTLG